MSDADLMRGWQRQWHAILDEHDHPEPLERPTPMLEIGADTRLHFSFWAPEWEAGIPARAKAFAVLPRGEDILARIETCLSAPPAPIDAGEAEAMLRQGLTMVAGLGFEIPDLVDPIRKLDESAVSAIKAFERADTPFIALFDALPEMARLECGPVGEQAFYFLSEPLYQLAASYDVANWIRWPLCAPSHTADPTEMAYRLYRGGWSTGWDEHGPFLLRRRSLVQQSAAAN